ncbi:hypothetical protein BCV72DRAFT_227860 [Rhizopus microsporus var. microsporus]|uniref:Uncharacterized protein n=2 Tax=Rhizopus microsporus TaxID=58291 RepID=A0A2G4T707_RHIZD|nr:uncharacterized protein RHIMIDRAFT_266793 [Rhizopus microsporus ATCC 52813]ORE06738.1 hypothetical protein BCV72DRAFT_227860 [Rhizopus microsporus var. microsporus]PHZ16779.1 hypothetical protein RHIMIDRAFT_266793 [Rhizopus microsporus ATCC 52813]
MALTQPVSNTKMYELLFVDSNKLNEILEKRFDPLMNTLRQIKTWVNKSNTWDNVVCPDRQESPVEGRYVWALKDKYLEVDAMNDLTKYQMHLRSHPMINIGYARKPPTNERFDKATRPMPLHQGVHFPQLQFRRITDGSRPNQGQQQLRGFDNWLYGGYESLTNGAQQEIQASETSDDRLCRVEY